MIFDYETLKLIWWLFVAVLLIGFAITDGFDLGICALLPFLGKNDLERRVIINSIGPTWEGNQVWFITLVGAVFAAWPEVYAAVFSGFYWAMLLVLFALFIRPVGFDYRSKLVDTRWRTAWDWGLFIGGMVPALMFGVIFGNLLQGVPFQFDKDLRSIYTGSFFGLFNSFSLLCGVISLTMLVMHSAIFLQIKTEGDIQLRSKKVTKLFGFLFVILFAIAGIWVSFGIEGYRVISMPDTNGTPNILDKIVEKMPGAWLSNYSTYSWTILAPVLGFSAAFAAIFVSAKNKPGTAFVFSSIMLAAVILTAGISMFPFIMPSSSSPNNSLLMWDAVSSHLTLTWLFWVVVFFLPIVLVYTSWVYRVMRGKVTEEQIKQNQHNLY